MATCAARASLRRGLPDPLDLRQCCRVGGQLLRQQFLREAGIPERLLVHCYNTLQVLKTAVVFLLRRIEHSASLNCFHGLERCEESLKPIYREQARKCMPCHAIPRSLCSGRSLLVRLSFRMRLYKKNAAPWHCSRRSVVTFKMRVGRSLAYVQWTVFKKPYQSEASTT